MVELAHFTRGHHDPACTGCPACNPYFADMYRDAMHGDHTRTLADFEAVRVHISSGGHVPLPAARQLDVAEAPDLADAIRERRQNTPPLWEPVPPPTQGTEPILPTRPHPSRPSPGETPDDAPDLGDAVRRYRKERAQ